MSITDLQPTAEGETGANWEDLADFTMSLTLRVSGRINALQKVPGTCPAGKWGLWYPSAYPLAIREYTHGITSYFRDKNMSSTDSVLVLMSLALDTPTMTTMGMAWETESAIPPPPPEEAPDGLVPPLMAYALTFLRTPVTSSVDHKRAETIFILTTTALPPDYEAGDMETRARKGLHRRDSPMHNSEGFGLVLMADLMKPNWVTPTYIYGITEKGATPNVVRTTGRFIWHSEQRSVEEIVRRRTPKDFVYISKKKVNVGGNNPCLFTLYTRHGKFYRMVRGGYKELLEEYERIRKREEREKQEMALKLKMENASAKVMDRLTT
jgi:hypothetical protein